MKKNEISLFFQHLPPFPGAGSRRAQSIISSFNLEKFKLNIYSTNIKNRSKKNITFHNIYGPKMGNKENYIFRFLKELLTGIHVSFKLFLQYKRPDLLIISSPSYFAFLILALFAKLRKINYALEIRDIYPEVFVHSGLLNNFNFIVNFFHHITTYIYQNSSLIICSNRLIEKNIFQKIKSDKVKTVFNGFPDEMIKFSDSKFKKFTICFHGVLGVFQDVHTLSKVIEKLELENVNIIAIGYGPKEKLLQNLNQKNFKFYGKKTLNETLKIVSKCHIGLSLRTNDYISKNCFPVKNWEYLGAGIPTVNTPYNEAAMFCQKNKIGFSCDSGEIISIVNIIKKYIDNEELYKKHKDNCLKIRNNYSRSVTGNQSVKLFTQVI